MTIILFLNIYILFLLNIFFNHADAHQTQDWKRSEKKYNYEIQYGNKAIIAKQPIAIAIIAFNRPEYLAKVITSLENNLESQSLPFFFFLDGGPEAKQTENIALINASTIKHKIIITRKHNYGCPKNHIDSKRFMFDWCGFEKIVVIEEDLVVSPSFIHLTLELHKWAKEHFSNVGVVQCWSYCYLNQQSKLEKLNMVEASERHWCSFVGYCLDKEVWNNMKPFLYQYELFLDQIPQNDKFNKARSKPGFSSIAPSIRNWIKAILPTRPPFRKKPGKKLFPSNSDHLINKYFSSDIFEPNQDAMTAFALWMAGYIKIRTVVNRAQHIGQEGITCNKAKYQKKFQPINLDYFTNQDLQLHQFVINRDKPTWQPLDKRENMEKLIKSRANIMQAK